MEFLLFRTRMSLMNNNKRRKGEREVTFYICERWLPSVTDAADYHLSYQTAAEQSKALQMAASEGIASDR
jgi:hypothetical protein